VEVTDPVCGMTFDEDDAVISVEYEGQAYHFCSRACEQKFLANPVRYLSKAEPEEG
jgi:Cu+-exporting ATPase